MSARRALVHGFQERALRTHFALHAALFDSSLRAASPAAARIAFLQNLFLPALRRRCGRAYGSEASVWFGQGRYAGITPNQPSGDVIAPYETVLKFRKPSRHDSRRPCPSTGILPDALRERVAGGFGVSSRSEHPGLILRLSLRLPRFPRFSSRSLDAFVSVRRAPCLLGSVRST